MFPRIKFLLLSLIILISSSLFGNEALNEANELYKNELYDEARLAYKNIIADDNTFSSTLYFNLASSYAMIGRKGQAVLWYERALRINPFDKDINRALEFMTSEKNNYPLLMFLNYLFVLIFIILFTLSVLFFILYTKSKNRKHLFMKLFLPMFALSIMFFATVLFINGKKNTEYLVVVNDSNMYEGASLSNQSSMPINEGSKLFLIDENENWFYVRNSLGIIGWIEKGSARRI